LIGANRVYEQPGNMANCNYKLVDSIRVPTKPGVWLPLDMIAYIHTAIHYTVITLLKIT